MNRSRQQPGEAGERPRVLTVDEAAKVLRISRGLAFQAVRTGVLPHLRIGRRILIPTAALTTLLGDQDTRESSRTRPSEKERAGDERLADARQAALRELATTLEAMTADALANRPSRANQ